MLTGCSREYAKGTHGFIGLLRRRSDARTDGVSDTSAVGSADALAEPFARSGALECPASTPRVPREYPIGDVTRVSVEYPSSTPRVPREYPASTPRVPREYPASTPRVPLEYPSSTFRVPFEYLSSTFRVPFEYFSSTPRVPFEYPLGDLLCTCRRKQTGYSSGPHGCTLDREGTRRVLGLCPRRFTTE